MSIAELNTERLDYLLTQSRSALQAELLATEMQQVVAKSARKSVWKIRLMRWMQPKNFAIPTAAAAALVIMFSLQVHVKQAEKISEMPVVASQKDAMFRSDFASDRMAEFQFETNDGSDLLARVNFDA